MLKRETTHLPTGHSGKGRKKRFKWSSDPVSKIQQRSRRDDISDEPLLLREAVYPVSQWEVEPRGFESSGSGEEHKRQTDNMV